MKKEKPQSLCSQAQTVIQFGLNFFFRILQTIKGNTNTFFLDVGNLKKRLSK